LRARRQFLPVEISAFFAKPRFYWRFKLAQPMQTKTLGALMRRELRACLPMENALLVGLSAQLALRRSMDVVANNVANVSTAGFKRENPLFEQVLANIETSDALAPRKEVAFVRDWGVLRDLSAGPMEQTGGALDVALDGDAYFAVQTANGERFTRDGQFKMDVNGRLVTAAGDAVMGEGGEIVLPANAKDIKIAADGSISTQDGQAGRLRLVSFDNQRKLIKDGGNLYESKEPALPAQNARVSQGFVERSNVQGVSEITRMIEISRAYSAVSESLSQTEETLKRAVSKLGEVKA
jgi:flagellar basal-body rod protein FlgF